jgi:hypothetical protein
VVRVVPMRIVPMRPVAVGIVAVRSVAVGIVAVRSVAMRPVPVGIVAVRQVPMRPVAVGIVAVRSVAVGVMPVRRVPVPTTTQPADIESPASDLCHIRKLVHLECGQLFELAFALLSKKERASTPLFGMSLALRGDQSASRDVRRQLTTRHVSTVAFVRQGLRMSVRRGREREHKPQSGRHATACPPASSYARRARRASARPCESLAGGAHQHAPPGSLSGVYLGNNLKFRRNKYHGRAGEQARCLSDWATHGEFARINGPSPNIFLFESGLMVKCIPIRERPHGQMYMFEQKPMGFPFESGLRQIYVPRGTT